MTAFGFDRKVALVRRTGTDRDLDGNRSRTETATLIDGIFAPGGSSELNNQQQRTIDSDSFILPPGTDVDAVDAIVDAPVLDEDGNLILDSAGHAQGDYYEVKGDPTDWRHPNGWAPGMIVTVERVRG